MPTLTVVMIAKNEAHCLGDCLASVQEIADATVVGDTGSADATPRIARAAGARVIDVPWRDDFAAARNAVLAEAPGDWLLHMDADEVLDPAGAATLRRLVDEDGAGCDAFEITLANYCNDPRAWRWTPARPDDPLARGWSGYLPVPLLRLFRNGRGYEYREPVHENITQSVLEAGGRIGGTDIVIHHYGYGAGSPEKAARYLAIARRKLETHPDDVKALHDFAEQAIACGLSDDAEAACRTALSIEPDHLGAGTTLANTLLNRGALGEARGVLEHFAAQPDPAPHVLMALGALECREGALAAAKKHLLASLTRQPRSPMARATLARVFDLEGEGLHAEKELQVACEIAPGIAEFADRLKAHNLRRDGERLVQAGYSEEALETLVEALRLDPEDPVTHNDLGVVLHMMGENGRARESIERALKLAPGMADAAENLRMLDGV
ncbi:MAG: glycosyltransferase [Candidatus Hydrogenedens sp.]|nr:glycosyltransferase [Candidatus Hydrogenedens sp.]